MMVSNKIKKPTFFSDTSGVTAIQYGLIASLAGTAIIGATTTMGGEIGQTLYTAAQTLAWGGGNDGLVGDGDFRVDNAGNVTQIMRHLTRVDSIEGWTSSVDNLEIKPSGIQATTLTGGDWIDMTSGIGQNVELTTSLTLVPGQEYTLNFEASNYAATTELEVLFGGEVVDTISGPVSNQFSQYSYTITGGEGNGSNDLTFREIGDDSDYAGTGLANISVSAG